MKTIPEIIDEIYSIPDLKQYILDAIDNAKAITSKIEKCETVINLAAINLKTSAKAATEAKDAFGIATKTYSCALSEVNNLTKTLYKMFDLIFAACTAFDLSSDNAIIKKKTNEASKAYYAYKSVPANDSDAISKAINNFLSAIIAVKDAASHDTAETIEKLLNVIGIIHIEIDKAVCIFKRINEIKNQIEASYVFITIGKSTPDTTKQKIASAIYDAFPILGIKHTKAIASALNAASAAAAASSDTYHDKVAIASQAIQAGLNDD